jgi:OFA family oxalate/formate antiporter-like MFS transporter
MKWYPDKKGFIAGLAVAGFGAGALFFAGPASVLLLPPAADGSLMNLKEILMVGIGLSKGNGFGIGWQTFFILHGILCTLAVLIGAALLRNPPAGWKPEGWNPQASGIKTVTEMNWKEMLNTPLASMLWMTFIFGATSGLMAIGQWTPMMASILGDRTFAPAWMGTFGRFVEPIGILAIFNAFGRIFWGKISDKIGRPRAMMLMFLLQGMTFILLMSVAKPLAIFIASAFVGLNFGGNFALFPPATADYFGTKNIGINYGWIFTAYGVAGILGPVAGGVLFDATKQYIMAFVFAGTLSFVAAGCAVVIWGLARIHAREANPQGA